MEGERWAARGCAVVVEDDPDVRHLIAALLNGAGFEVVEVAEGHVALAAVESLDPVLVTLDLSLPSLDGLGVLRRIRDFSSTYVVIVTGRADEADLLQGLALGADAYITKPFGPREFRARVEAVLRRPMLRLGGGGVPAPVVATPEPAPAPADLPPGWDGFGDLACNRIEQRVTVDGAVVELSADQFRLLVAVLYAADGVRTHEELGALLGVRGFSQTHPLTPHERRTVERCVDELRTVLGEHPDNPRWIEAVPGGFRRPRLEGRTP